MRQEDIWGDGSDQQVYFQPEFAEKIIKAIQEAAGALQQPATLARVGRANEKA